MKRIPQVKRRASGRSDCFDACIAHQKLPLAHRKVTRTTNLLEWLFGEERRRTKTIPHALW